MENSTTHAEPVCFGVKLPPTAVLKFFQLPDGLCSRIWEFAGLGPLSKEVAQTPRTFARFGHLPTEIRGYIWNSAMDAESAYTREFKVNGWSKQSSEIQYIKNADSWTKPWSEAIHPPFTADQWEETAPGEPIFEAISFREPRLPRHTQHVLASCREARAEFTKRFIRFSGSATRNDLLIFDEFSRVNQPTGRGFPQGRAQIVSRSGATHYQVDSEHSAPPYFDTSHDRLFVPSFFRISDILDRWLPKNFIENLRSLSITETYITLNGGKAERMLLRFSKLEELVVFGDLLGPFTGPLDPPPDRALYLDAKSYVQRLERENPWWK